MVTWYSVNNTCLQRDTDVNQLPPCMCLVNIFLCRTKKTTTAHWRESVTTVHVSCKHMPADKHEKETAHWHESVTTVHASCKHMPAEEHEKETAHWCEPEATTYAQSMVLMDSTEKATLKLKVFHQWHDVWMFYVYMHHSDRLYQKRAFCPHQIWRDLSTHTTRGILLGCWYLRPFFCQLVEGPLCNVVFGHFGSSMNKASPSCCADQILEQFAEAHPFFYFCSLTGTVPSICWCPTLGYCGSRNYRPIC